MAKKEELEFEVENLEAPMVTEMESKQEVIEKKKKAVVNQSKAANKKRLKEEIERREIERQNEI
jgi:hypothetical protein